MKLPTYITIIVFSFTPFCCYLFMKKPSDENLKKVEQGYASKINFQGHTYVVWSINAGGSLVHDPDCKCITNKKEK